MYETPLISPSAFGFFTSSKILLLFSNASTTLLQARLLLFSLRSISSSLLYSPFLPTFNLYRNGNPVAVLNIVYLNYKLNQEHNNEHLLPQTMPLKKIHINDYLLIQLTTVPFTVISLKFQEQIPHFIIHIPTL